MPVPIAHRDRSWIQPVALAAFALACLVFGGSSRADAPTLLILRPTVVVALIVFALHATRARIAAVRALLLLLGAFAITITIQLVPIPASIWACLQARAPYAAALAELGLGGHAHPLSLTPDATWNSLIALLVPLTMLLGYATVDRSTRSMLLPALVLGGMASAILGIAQLAAGPDSPLYLYRSTNNDYPVGVFANRNHEAAFLAIMFPALRAWALGERPRTHSSPTPLPRTPVTLAIGIFLVPMILVTGSRAGVALMLLGIGAAWAVAPMGLPRLKSRGQRWIVLGVTAGIALLVVVTIASGRAAALQRLIATNDPTSDLRVAYLPTMIGLMHRFWLFGAGFGSFDPVLRGSEPDALLHGLYFNHAHNELIELVLNGGVASMLVLLAFLVWWGRAAFAAFVAPAHQADVPVARAATLMIGLLLLASLVDYPLRTPLLGAVMALLCAQLYQALAPARVLPVARGKPER